MGKRTYNININESDGVNIDNLNCINRYLIFDVEKRIIMICLNIHY